MIRHPKEKLPYLFFVSEGEQGQETGKSTLAVCCRSAVRTGKRQRQAVLDGEVQPANGWRGVPRPRWPMNHFI